ncbi:ASCH domain-containing protein [Agrobacterium vitis]|uniref:ASCH domain-containing protein n=1 Tax=Agrobacterium vitis TaxID=373 RepID=UPI0012E8B51B|nr:ASCH domain-containing protein [Agrobacterium vitis]MVA24002.1 ASCH domain-containing protein [Agrobacterium vitis]
MIELPEPHRDAVTFAFGDSPELADQLLGLVLAGKKTATCGALRDFGPKGEPIPVVGRRDVVLDGAGRAAAVIETVEVTIRRFDEVDAAFAHDEGEDDQTLEAWRVGHEVYFARNGGFTPDMELVCERFRLVDILKRDQG